MGVMISEESSSATEVVMGVMISAESSSATGLVRGVMVLVLHLRFLTPNL
jgi:hypothetical protein